MKKRKLAVSLLLIWLLTVWWFPSNYSLDYGNEDHELARIISGETPGCAWEAKLAVGHVHSRNKVWFGDRAPTADDALAALVWRYVSDPSAGAFYMIAPADRDKMPWLKLRTNRWNCPHGYVETWKE